MCKHVLNARVAFRPTCCDEWYECVECHEEKADHTLHLRDRLAMACLHCRNVFWMDLQAFSKDDYHCPLCHKVVVEPAVTPETRVDEEATLFFTEELDELMGRIWPRFKPEEEQEEEDDDEEKTKAGLLHNAFGEEDEDDDFVWDHGTSDTEDGPLHLPPLINQNQHSL